MNAQNCLKYCHEFASAVPDLGTARNIVEWLADTAMTVAESRSDIEAVENMKRKAQAIMQHPDELSHRAAINEAYALVGKLDQVWRNCIALSPYADEWAAFHAHKVGEAWPNYLELAYKAHTDAVQRYYLLRDGPKGFLGKYGL